MNSEVHLHTPNKFGEDPSKDLGGVGEETNRQTNAARIIVWCSPSGYFMSGVVSHMSCCGIAFTAQLTHEKKDSLAFDVK